MVKKICLAVIKYSVLAALIIVAIISMFVGIGINRKIASVKKITTVLDYDIIAPLMGITASTGAEIIKARDEFKAREEYKAVMGNSAMAAKYYKAFSDVEGLYVVNPNHYSVWIDCASLPHFPDNNQMEYGYGLGGSFEVADTVANVYASKREKYNKGEKEVVTFYALQADSRIEGADKLPLLEGELNDITIKYSDYVNTDNPIPVVVGCELADLFSVGDVIDVTLPFAVAGDLDEFFALGKCNAKIKITGILSEDARVLQTNRGNIKVHPVNTAIILPFFDFTAGEFENEVDNAVFKKIYGIYTSQIRIVTKMSREEGSEKVLQVVDEFGLGEIYTKIVGNSSYYVKGVSIYTYEKLLYTVFYASLVLLAVALCGAVIFSVNRNVRKYSIHFLVGADKSYFVLKTVLPLMSSAVAACVAAQVLFWRFADEIKKLFGSMTLKRAETIWLSIAILVGVAAFVFLVALIKINKTDFSRTLKEDI